MCRKVSPSVPGAHLQVRSFMFLDQQVMLTGFSGGTGRDKKKKKIENQEVPELGFFCFFFFSSHGGTNPKSKLHSQLSLCIPGKA